MERWTPQEVGDHIQFMNVRVEVVSDSVDLAAAEQLLMFELLVGDKDGDIAVVQILHRSGDALHPGGVRRPQPAPDVSWLHRRRAHGGSVRNRTDGRRREVRAVGNGSLVQYRPPPAR
jgi:hypothetical protein